MHIRAKWNESINYEQPTPFTAFADLSPTVDLYCVDHPSRHGNIFECRRACPDLLVSVDCRRRQRLRRSTRVSGFRTRPTVPRRMVVLILFSFVQRSATSVLGCRHRLRTQDRLRIGLCSDSRLGGNDCAYMGLGSLSGGCAMSLESDLARVRGLGSAKDGTRSFWHQRITAIALVPLSLWFVVSLLCVMAANHADTVAWIKAPYVTTLFIALIVVLFYHVKIGLQEVVEDYVHLEWLKLATRICLSLGAAMCGLASIVAILKISFGT